MSKYLILNMILLVGCAPLLGGLAPKESLSVDPKTAPKVMISIPEYKAGEDVASRSFAPQRSKTEQIFIQTFKNIGYPVIEKTGDTTFWANPQAMLFADDTTNQSNADILVIGQAVSDTPKYERSSISDLVRVETPVRIDVKIVKVSTGEVLWIDSVTYQDSDSYYGQPSQFDDPADVFLTPANRLSGKVAKDIHTKLIKPAGTLFYVTVIYGGTKMSSVDVAALKEVLGKNISGVSQLKEKNISEYSALFEIYYTGDAKALAALISQQRVGEKKIVINNLTQDNIVLGVQ
jgi:hypothetical protein